MSENFVACNSGAEPIGLGSCRACTEWKTARPFPGHFLGIFAPVKVGASISVFHSGQTGSQAWGSWAHA